jgi:CDP-diacylglycerol--glycerol-3-phosphate 3-phosphatidyltransferase
MRLPLNLPNAITLLRLLCVPFLIALLLQHRNAAADGAPAAVLNGYRLAALIVFVFGTVSDALDGWLARHLRQRTALGTILDPIADKLLLTAAILGISLPVGLPYRFPLWFPLIVISRDVLITIGTFVVFMLRGGVEIRPTRLGKISTASQMACVLAALLCIPELWATVLLVFTAATTVVSGLQYIHRGLHLVHDEHGDAQAQCTV